MNPRETSEAPLDWRRFGRQIALPEVGAAGQSALARTAVDFAAREPAVRACVATIYGAAGGRCEPGADAIRVEVPDVGAAPTRAQVLGVSAASAVEAARRVLGRTPADVSAALVARLAPPRSAP